MLTLSHITPPKQSSVSTIDIFKSLIYILIVMTSVTNFKVVFFYENSERRALDEPKRDAWLIYATPESLRLPSNSRASPLIGPYRPTKVKDLGVLVDDCLKFHVHVNHIVSSAFTRANYLILKCFNSRNVQVLLRAFKHSIYPLLYCECDSRSMCCQSLNMLLAFGLLTSLLISVKLKVFSANLLSAFLAVAI